MPTPSGHTRAIRASRVIGTRVYNLQFEAIGEIHDVMLDKMSNDIMFAVVNFGGFLGIGEKYHAVPWSLLDYQKDKGGYVVSLTKTDLKNAPAQSASELTASDGVPARDEAMMLISR